MKRGEIWWASLPDAAGATPGYRRPVLIVQSDAFTSSNIQTVIVATLTSNLRLANAPVNMFVRSDQSGLSKDSVVNVSQVITLDKHYLTDFVSVLPAKIVRRVEEGLRLILSL